MRAALGAGAPHILTGPKPAASATNNSPGVTITVPSGSFCPCGPGGFLPYWGRWRHTSSSSFKYCAWHASSSGFGRPAVWQRRWKRSRHCNFVPSKHRPSDTPKGRLPRILRLSGNRLISDQPQPESTYVFFSPGAKYPAETKKLVSPALQYAVDLSAGKPVTVYLVRLNQAGQAGRIVADADSYAKARTSVIQNWDDRLGRGARFDVPEREVMKTRRALFVQNLYMGKWYSIGNFYQTSYTEQYNALKSLGLSTASPAASSTGRRGRLTSPAMPAI